MINKTEYQTLLARLTGLRMQMGFGRSNPDKEKEAILKNFTEREIRILIEGNALSQDFLNT